MSQKLRAVDFFGTPVLLPAENKDWAALEERLRVVIQQELRAGLLKFGHKLDDLNAKLIKIDFLRGQAAEDTVRQLAFTNKALAALHTAIGTAIHNDVDLVEIMRDLPYAVRDQLLHPSPRPIPDDRPAADDTPPPRAEPKK